MQLPIATWSTLILPIFLTVSTLSGICGFAASGTSFDKSMVISSSYVASSSGRMYEKSLSLPCAFKNSFVMSSLGKTDVVAPSSAPIFVMVALSGTDKVLTPSPEYSITLPTPPFTVKRRRTSRMMSFAATHGLSLPTRLTFTTFGIVM